MAVTNSGAKTLLASAAIANALLLTIDTSGQYALNGAGQIPRAVSVDGTASGGQAVGEFLHTGATFRVTCATACSIGDRLYAAASGKVSTTKAGKPLFIALEASSGDGAMIECLPVNGTTATDYTAIAASTAITNTTTETAFDLSYTILANSLKIGDVIEIDFQGIATATNSSDTLGIKVYVGAVEVMAIAAVDAVDNDIFSGSLKVVIRTIGLTGTCVATGRGATGASGTITSKERHKASQTMDTTADQAVTVKATWSVASASNSCRLDILNVRVAGKA